MTDRDALYRAVLENPDDDLPRLAYADWCEEHDDPGYARFIRTQVELARVPEWDPLWLRASAHERGVIGPGFPYPRPRLPPGFELLGFRRGFAWHVRTTGTEAFTTSAPALMAAAPIQAVEVSSALVAHPTDTGRLAGDPALARLRRLSFARSGLTADGIRRLADSPHAAGLTDLGLFSGGITADGIRELFRSPLIGRLTRLRFFSTGAVGAGIPAAVAAAEGPHRLRSLGLTETTGGRADLVRLFDAPLLRGVAELDLSVHDLGRDGFAALAASPAAAVLESLSLRRTAPGLPGARALAASPALANLRRLDLRSCNVGPLGVQALAASPHLRNLVDLDLGGNSVKESGAAALAASPHLRNLVRLDLEDGDIGDRGALALLDSPVTAGLARLYVHEPAYMSRVSDDVRKRLKDRFGDRVSV